MPTWEDVVEIGTRLPGVELGTSFRTPALRVRLEAVDPVELAELLEDAWRVFAAKRVVKAWDEERAG